MAHCLGVDRLFLYLNMERPLTANERLCYRDLVRRRAAREPVSLIIGKKEFWSLSLKVDHGILIPRPDTEILVSAVLSEIAELKSPMILEIGTGSGAISVAVGCERTDAFIVATDISRRSLEIAGMNINTYGLGNSIDLLKSDLLSAIRKRPFFDVICSNPPYIVDHIIDTLDPEINYEPRSALSGGSDGLYFIRDIVKQAPFYLKKGGGLILEIGDDQADAVWGLMSEGGFSRIEVKKDLSGKPRVIKGAK